MGTRCKSLMLILGALFLCLINTIVSAQPVIEAKSPLVTIRLDTTGMRSITLSDVAYVRSSVTPNPVVRMFPSSFTCTDIGLKTVTVVAEDSSGVDSLKVQVNVTGSVTITYPTAGVFKVPAYYPCIGILPDFSRITKVKTSCNDKVTISLSVPPDTQVPLYANDTLSVTLTATDQTGNKDSVELKIVAFSADQPVIKVSATDSVICAGANVIFQRTISGFDNYNGNWQLNGIVVPGEVQATFSSSNLKDGDIISYDIPSVCQDYIKSNSLRIKVNPSTNPIVTINTKKQDLCTKDTLSFIASLSYPLNHQKYSWTVNGIKVSASDSLFVSNNLNDGDHVECSISGLTPCLGQVTVVGDTIARVIKEVIPAVKISPGDTSICAGFTEIVFKAELKYRNDNFMYNWQINGRDINVHDSIFIAKSIKDGDVVNCVITDEKACFLPIKSNNSSVKIKPLPTIFFNGDPTIKASSSIMLHPLVTGDIVSYKWFPSQGLNDPALPNPIASPQKTTTYTLIVTSGDGCESSNAITVYIQADLMIPNTFSPNGDGINDIWDLHDLSHYPNCSVDIFTRYGLKIFHSIGYSKAWDGSFNGHPLSAGVYYYIINLNNNEKPFSGSLTIIR